MKKVVLVLLVLILATLACNSGSGDDTSSGASGGDSGSGDTGGNGDSGGDASATEIRGPADAPELPAATSDQVAPGRFTANVFAEGGVCIMNLGIRVADDGLSFGSINVNASTRLVSRPVSDINLEPELVVPIEDGAFTFEGVNAEVTLTVVGHFTSETTLSGYYSLIDDEGNGCQNIAFEGELSE